MVLSLYRQARPHFLVCKNSRRSVPPFDPLCLNSSIRVNLSLDTIYFDRTSDNFVLDFFSDLIPKETTELKSIAFCHELLDLVDIYDDYDPNAKWNKIWERLKEYLEKLPNMRECNIFMDVVYTSHLVKEPVVSDQTKLIEFVQKFRTSLCKRLVS